MSEDQVYKLEQATGCFAVDGHCDGLYYFLYREGKDRGKIAIGGSKGITILTNRQARSVAEDILDIINQYGY